MKIEFYILIENMEKLNITQLSGLLKNLNLKAGKTKAEKLEVLNNHLKDNKVENIEALIPQKVKKEKTEKVEKSKTEKVKKEKTEKVEKPKTEKVKKEKTEKVEKPKTEKVGKTEKVEKPKNKAGFIGAYKIDDIIYFIKAETETKFKEEVKKNFGEKRAILNSNYTFKASENMFEDIKILKKKYNSLKSGKGFGIAGKITEIF